LDKKPEKLESEQVQIKISTYENVSYDMSIFNTGKKVHKLRLGQKEIAITGRY
jgi:hypothetical protein